MLKLRLLLRPPLLRSKLLPKRLHTQLKARLHAGFLLTKICKRVNTCMKYFDYVFDIEPDRIEFDVELTLGKLKMKEGDYWQVCSGPQGTVILQKVDPVVAFTQGYAINTKCE